MKIFFLLFPIISLASIPRPPEFLKKASMENIYETSYSGGFLGTRFGADVSLREKDLLKRHPKLKGIHPDLQEIIDVASHHVELIVFEGCRTLVKQKEYVKKGLSKTLNSRHLKCAAVDVVFKHKEGKVNWSWEQSIATIKYLRGIGAALRIKCLRDGSSWNNGLDVSKTKFKDGFHLEKMANCSS